MSEDRLDVEPFVDGGLGANNPTLCALTEIAHCIHDQESCEAEKKETQKGASAPPLLPIKLVLSLGCGYPMSERTDPSVIDEIGGLGNGIISVGTNIFGFVHLAFTLMQVALETQGHNVEMARAWCTSLGAAFLRLNPMIVSKIDIDTTDLGIIINALFETELYMHWRKKEVEVLCELLCLK